MRLIAGRMKFAELLLRDSKNLTKNRAAAVFAYIFYEFDFWSFG
jgi:hypothetical protein